MYDKHFKSQLGTYSICLICLPDILQGYESIDRENGTLSAQLDAMVDMKFTHVVSCQIYGLQKASGDAQAKDILELMIRYFSLVKRYIVKFFQLTVSLGYDFI